MDAFSYVGGIFQTFIGLCIFVPFFNAAHFEMKFAADFFKCKEAKDFNFFTYIKQCCYDSLYKTSFQPNWEEAELRRRLREAVTKIQDIIYLNRRIEFL